MRKAQITVFIIIGIAIVLSIFLYLYLSNRTIIFKPEVVVPEDVAPIQQYVETCIYDTVKAGILTLGMQSGFIEIPEDILGQPASFISVDPWRLLVRPYWYYKGQTRIPTEDYIKYQITKHLEDNIGSCLDGFASFSHQFEIEAGELSADTTLGDRSVDIAVSYPLTIRSRKLNKVTKLEEFKQKIPVRLKPTYELAKKIMMAENDQMFLENVTIDLMASTPDIPFTGMEFSCHTLKWPLTEVESELKDMLFYNLQRIRVENTQYAEFEAPKSVYERFGQYTMEDINEGDLPSTLPPSDAYEYFHFLFDVGSTDDSLRAKIVYRPEWGMDIAAHPTRNGELRSDLVKGPGQFMRYLCVNIYHFVYDVTYPVEVIVRDDSSFGGEGYIFAMAFPVVIYHNQGSRIDRGTMQFVTRPRSEGFCENLGGTVEITVLGTYEGYTDMEIPGVEIDYECMVHRCELGTTHADGGHYRLRTMIPAGCANPFIIANKTGYLETRQQVLDNKVNVEMKKLRPLDFSVVKHIYYEADDKLGDAVPLGDGERAIISLSMINHSFRQYLHYPIPENGTSEIELVEDTAAYNLDIVFIKDDDYVGGYVDEQYSVDFFTVLGTESVEFHVVEYRPTPVTEKQKLEMTSYLLDGAYKSQIGPVLR